MVLRQNVYPLESQGAGVGLDTNSDGFVASWSRAVSSKAWNSKDIQEFLDWAEASEVLFSWFAFPEVLLDKSDVKSSALQIKHIFLSAEEPLKICS